MDDTVADATNPTRVRSGQPYGMQAGAIELSVEESGPLGSGIIDMLGAEETAVRAAMNNSGYAAAAGHAIAAAGAALTVIAAGALLAKGISGGAIGTGLIAPGMLIVAIFSNNDYETLAGHCFLGEVRGETVTPD